MAGRGNGAWLVTIAYHLSINYLDKVRRRRSVPLSDSNDVADEYSAEHEEQLQALDKAMRKLPEDDRKLIRMHYYEGMKTDEIASKTGMSQSNVLVKLHRIRERLKKEISNERDK